MAELEQGASLAGYRIEALVGHGSTGSVYSAEDVALERRVALKVLLPELARDERFRERFLRESKLAASLEHPHIVPIHGVGEEEGILFLAMRYVGGRDLSALLMSVGRLELERAASICEQIGSALDVAHDYGLVHRDVKPGNILVARESGGDYAYLCDFGLAKHAATATSLTGARAVVGTVDYLSPEQIEGLPVDGRTDVYALGCVLYECLTGEPPYARGNELAAILAHRTEPPPKVTAHRSELPDALDAVIARALEKDREHRYSTCAELIDDARSALRGTPLATPRRQEPQAPAIRTFLFSDIRGYTSYTREHGDEAAADLAERFATIVGELAPTHGGRLQELRGDEALVMFDSARQALRFGVALQQRVAAEALPRGVGVGLDAGEAVPVTEGFRGGALNRAARLCSLARAGDVLASENVVQLAGEVEGIHYGLRRLERLKGLAKPAAVVEVHPSGLPPTRQLARRAKRTLLGTRPRVRLAAAVVIAGVALAASLSMLLAPGPATPGAGFRPDSIALLDSRTGKPEGTTAAGLHTCLFAAVRNQLWACDADQPILLRVDAKERRVADQVPLPVFHGGFTVGFGSVWVGDVASPTVYVVDPRYRTSSSPIRLPGVPARSPTGTPENATSLVTAKNAVWVAYGYPKRIAKIDPEARRVIFNAPLPQECPCNTLLAADGGSIWAVASDGLHIFRLDPTTGRTRATGRLHQGRVTGVAVADGYLWVALYDDGAVWKVDPSGNAVDEVRTGAGASSIAAADGYLWVANADAGTVTRVDPRSGATRQYRVGHRPLAVAEIAGTLFVGLAEGAAEASGRVGGARVVRAVVASTDIGVDPAFASDSAERALAYAAGARLMEARTGHDGTTIEPELAAAPPTVSADGRTYTFAIRDGLRFSPPSAQPITTETVRYSIERALSPKLLDHNCRDLVLNDIVGESAYEQGAAEHITGIGVDGNRLAITLIRPSQTLPARLASPCLSVVPIGTPVIPVALSHPIASAGPYYVDSFVPGEQLVLRRNQNYDGGRPQKLDAIILREGVAPDRAGRLVEQGQVDYAADPERPPTPAFAPGGRYEKAFGTAGQRLRYVRPASSVDALLLFNTRRGIFREASLRRAANFALDRRALAALVGGEPASSLIPPGIPGHRATQPYSPTADAARAHALARGRRGTAVVAVQAGDAVTEQLVQLVGRDLARIGIELKAQPAADPIALASKDRTIDVLGLAWGADYLDPFGVVNALLQPQAHSPGFPSFFVDSRWITRLAHAADAPPNERARVYAELDSDLARGPAPFSVLFNLPGVPQLFSKRIGCERFLPQFEGWVDFSSLCVR